MLLTSSRLTWAETQRKLAHMAAFWPALFLPWMSPLQALSVTFLLLVMNVFILPWAAPGLYRAEETGMGALEVVLYPAALMACVAAFGFTSADVPSSADSTASIASIASKDYTLGKPAWYLPVVAAWFALAFVDACIGFACRILPRGPVLPWNPRKPALAVLLGALIALLPAYALAHLALPGLAARPAGWIAITLLVLVAACAETAWFGVADNVVIPFFLCALIPLIPNPLTAAGTSPSLFSSLPWYWAVAPIGFGALAYGGRMLTLGGAVLGAIMAFLLILADPWLFAFVGGFFAFGNLATRFGFARKQARGIAEARGGRRGAAEVFGAMGLAAWMTPLVHLAKAGGPAGIGAPTARHGVASALLVCIAPLVAKTMDTVSSEMGKAIGGKTLSLKSFRTVPPGSEGGVSWAGTLCGLAAAICMALAILALGWGGWADVLILLAIALAANVFESFWGEWAAPRGMDQGPHTNILMTLVAAVAAWLVWFGRS